MLTCQALSKHLCYINANREIREKLKKDVNDMGKKYPGFAPGLAIVQVGAREDSNVYIRMKIKAASEIGIRAQHVQLSKNISEAQLLMKVENSKNRI